VTRPAAWGWEVGKVVLTRWRYLRWLLLGVVPIVLALLLLPAVMPERVVTLLAVPASLALVIAVRHHAASDLGRRLGRQAIGLHRVGPVQCSAARPRPP
jgi:hypothetical protein